MLSASEEVIWPVGRALQPPQVQDQVTFKKARAAPRRRRSVAPNTTTENPRRFG